MGVNMGSFELPENTVFAAGKIIELLATSLPCSPEDCTVFGTTLRTNGHDDAAISAVLDPVVLEDIRLSYNADLLTMFEERVRDEAERYRALFVTKRAGKQNAYQQKTPIAQRIVAAGGGADPADIALLQREADARSLTVADLAALITQKNAAYAGISDIIEGIEAESVLAVHGIPVGTDDIQSALETLLPQLSEIAEAALAALPPV